MLSGLIVWPVPATLLLVQVVKNLEGLRNWQVEDFSTRRLRCRRRSSWQVVGGWVREGLAGKFMELPRDKKESAVSCLFVQCERTRCDVGLMLVLARGVWVKR